MAPEGTVHEAFFDPIATGNATGYFNTGDALSDADFTVGTDNTAVSIQTLKHQGNVVTLEISPYRDLAGPERHHSTHTGNVRGNAE